MSTALSRAVKGTPYQAHECRDTLPSAEVMSRDACPRERNVDIEKWEEEGQLSLSLSLVAPTRDRHCVPHPVKILNSVEPGDNEVVSVQ